MAYHPRGSKRSCPHMASRSRIESRSGSAGAAALDAGGIRADLVGISDTHSRDAIVVTGTALLEALQNALAACEGSSKPSPRLSDPSSWPAATWVTSTA